jgi:hypothetical protein
MLRGDYTPVFQSLPAGGPVGTLNPRGTTMKPTIVLAILAMGLALGLAVPGVVSAQATKGDPGVTQQLDRLGLNYTVTKSGNFSVTYDLDGGRSQVAYIMGKTETVDTTDVRELWSRAGTFDAVPDADVMQNLLEESGSKKIGFWSIEETDKGGYTVYFSVKVPVYLKDGDLSSLLEYTANIADQKEEELFNTDDE